MSIAGIWDALVDAICRPPRDVYAVHELPGGKRGFYKHRSENIERQDLVLINKKGQRLQCSHFKPESTKGLKNLPVVIYCHCNSGSRRDAEESLHHLLPNGISVFTLDFAGSGSSEGDWVSLGAHESEDLEVVVQHLRTTYPSATIGLWGRSMGAVTALMYAAKDPSIAGVVADSGFARLTEVMAELVEEQKLPIPRPFMRVAIGMMRRSVRKRAKFNIDAVAPLDLVNSCYTPVLFGHADNDTFVRKSHTERLFAAYAGEDKHLETFGGDHNSVRPRKFYEAVTTFFHRALLCDDQTAAQILAAERRSSSRLREVEGIAQVDEFSRYPSQSTDSDLGGERSDSKHREMAPPWDRENTKSCTEKQLQTIRSNLEADLHMREQSKGIGKDDARHALLAAPCLKSVPNSSQRLGLSDSAGESDVEQSEGGRLPRSSGATRMADRGSDGQDLEESAIFERHATAQSQPAPYASIHLDRRTQYTQTPSSASSGRLKLGEEYDEIEALCLEQDRKDAELLEKAMALSLEEHLKSNPSTATPTTAPERFRSHIPPKWQSYDAEDAEEAMLAEALRQSLMTAAVQQPASPRAMTGSSPAATSQAIAESSPAPPSSSSQSTPDAGRRKRALFWRSKSSDSAPKTPNKQSQKH